MKFHELYIQDHVLKKKDGKKTFYDKIDLILFAHNLSILTFSTYIF